MSEPVVASLHSTWINRLHGFIVIYTGCKRPHACRGNNASAKAIKHNVEGLDVEYAEDGKEDDKDDHRSKDNKESVPSINDLPNELQVFTWLFQEDKHPTGDEMEAFTSPRTEILQHMETLNIQKNQPPSVLFTLLSGPPPKACTSISITDVSSDEMVEHIKKKVIYDREIKDHRVTSWKNATFVQFRNVTDAEEKATRICLECTTEYQKDLQTYLQADELLYDRIRSIFRHVSW